MSKKKVIVQGQGEGQEQEHECLTENGCGTVAQLPSPLPPPTQSLTADDILTSCGVPLRLEVPELPRNGKPGVVYIKRPSAEIMINFWSSRTDDNRDRESVMSELIGMLTVDDTGSLLFSPDQVSQIKDARYDVWQRLASGIDTVIKPIAANATAGDSGNPFEETKEPN